MALSTARLTVIAPLPEAGGDQSNVQDVAELLLWVILNPLICEFESGFDKTPSLTCNEYPPKEPTPPPENPILIE